MTDDERTQTTADSTDTASSAAPGGVEAQRIHIRYAGGPPYDVEITDPVTGKVWERIAGFDISIHAAQQEPPRASLYVYLPLLDLELGANWRTVCPCCGKEALQEDRPVLKTARLLAIERLARETVQAAALCWRWPDPDSGPAYEYDRVRGLRVAEYFLDELARLLFAAPYVPKEEEEEAGGQTP